MVTVHEYGKVHTWITNQIPEHVDLFWCGGFKRRIDCCRTLHIPIKGDVLTAVELLKRAAQEERPKRLASIFNEVRVKLEGALRLMRRSEALDFIGAYEELFDYVCKKDSETQHEYYRAATVDQRKGQAASATWDAWKKCRIILDGVRSLEIPDEELVQLRLTPLLQGQGTLYTAFLLWLHHGKDFGHLVDLKAIEGLLPLLYSKRKAYAFGSPEEHAYTEVIVFVRNMSGSKSPSDTMFLIETSLKHFLPEVSDALAALASRTNTIHEEYNTTLTVQAKWALDWLWATPLTAAVDMPLDEIDPCSTVLLAY